MPPSPHPRPEPHLRAIGAAATSTEATLRTQEGSLVATESIRVVLVERGHERGVVAPQSSVFGPFQVLNLQTAKASKILPYKMKMKLCDSVRRSHMGPDTSIKFPPASAAPQRSSHRERSSCLFSRQLPRSCHPEHFFMIGRSGCERVGLCTLHGTFVEPARMRRAPSRRRNEPKQLRRRSVPYACARVIRAASSRLGVRARPTFTENATFTGSANSGTPYRFRPSSAPVLRRARISFLCSTATFAAMLWRLALAVAVALQVRQTIAGPRIWTGKEPNGIGWVDLENEPGQFRPHPPISDSFNKSDTR